MIKSSLVRNASWLSVAQLSVRGAGLIQSVLLARTLGVSGYGMFGFLMSTLGVLAAFSGLQLGLTAMVFVARYRESDPARARLVVKKLSLLGASTGLGMFALLAPASPWLSEWLIGSDAPEGAFVMSMLVLPLSVVTGIQDGILKGFEDFRYGALVSGAQAAVGLALIVPGAVFFGLSGAFAALVLALAFKLTALGIRVRRHVRNLPRGALPSEGVSLRKLILEFALPTILGTLADNSATWLGSYLLSHQSGGFAQVAVVNVAIQWRSPLIMMATMTGSVIIPRISGFHAKGEMSQAHRLRGQATKWVGLVALGVVCAVSAGSSFILRAYGPGFARGELVLSLIVASAIPQVISQTHMQNLVAIGQAWLQMGLAFARSVPCALLLWYAVHRWGAAGYAWSFLASWSLFAIVVTLLDRRTSAAAR